jgi:DNA-binding transcriptional regulator PaaX
MIDALAEDTGEFLDYKRIRKKLHGSWDYQTNFSKAFANLRRYGYLEIVERDNALAVRLSKTGKLKIWRPRVERRWDGRWRLVAFDIEEKRKKTRDSFRTYLKQCGFKPMQKSLWISPYDVSEEVEELIDLLDIESNVDYFIADAITNKEKFIELFQLNQEK